jgi:hypothetical protein
MNDDTAYVHTYVIDYEPTYLALTEAAHSYREVRRKLSQARDMLAEAVKKHCSAMGLKLEVFSDVDYTAMIENEIGHHRVIEITFRTQSPLTFLDGEKLRKHVVSLEGLPGQSNTYYLCARTEASNSSDELEALRAKISDVCEAASLFAGRRIY